MRVLLQIMLFSSSLHRRHGPCRLSTQLPFRSHPAQCSSGAREEGTRAGAGVGGTGRGGGGGGAYEGEGGPRDVETLH